MTNNLCSPFGQDSVWPLKWMLAHTPMIGSKTDMNDDMTTPTLDVFREHVVDDGIDVFVYVTEEEREAVLDGHLQLLQEVWVVECAHLEG